MKTFQFIRLAEYSGLTSIIVLHNAHISGLSILLSITYILAGSQNKVIYQ